MVQQLSLVFFTTIFILPSNFHLLYCNSVCLQDNNVVRGSCITGIQTLLLSVMCNFASIFLSKKSPGVVTDDGTERCCFVEAAITFCKLQHLNHTASVKTQVNHLSVCQN